MVSLTPNTWPGDVRHANMPLGAPAIAFLGVDSSTVTALTAAETSVVVCTIRHTNPSENITKQELVSLLSLSDLSSITLSP